MSFIYDSFFMYTSFLWLLLPLGAYWVKRKVKQSFSQNLRWAVLALLIVAMARPVLPHALSKELVMAHSVIVALDLSVSMNASDIKPTRLKASKEMIKSFLELKRHEQIALICFTVNPLLLSPPTTDHELVKLALENMNSAFILTKGTDLKKLFEKIAKFKDKKKKVILFTDGGDELLDEELITFVQKENIEILAIAMASEQGASIRKKDGTLLENKEGHIVVSKLNVSLKTLSQQSGGKFIYFRTIAKGVSEIEAWLDAKDILHDGLERESKQYFELAFVPLLLALILFFLSATRFSKNFLVLFLFLGLNVQAEELITREQWGEGVKPLGSGEFTPTISEAEAITSHQWGVLDAYYLKRAYAEYEKKEYLESQKKLYKIKNRALEAELLLAHTFYRQEKYKQAKLVLKGIKSSDKSIKQQLYYELGNCEAQMRYGDKAKNYYVKALQLGEDEDVLHNLKIVLFLLKEDAFKVGYTNPSSAEKSNSQNEKVELQEEKSSSQKNESLGASGGTGSKKSKNATVKVMALDKESKSKRVLSSKAYDLINEGYINEEKPW